MLIQRLTVITNTLSLLLPIVTSQVRNMLKMYIMTKLFFQLTILENVEALIALEKMAANFFQYSIGKKILLGRLWPWIGECGLIILMLLCPRLLLKPFKSFRLLFHLHTIKSHPLEIKRAWSWGSKAISKAHTLLSPKDRSFSYLGAQLRKSSKLAQTLTWVWASRGLNFNRLRLDWGTIKSGSIYLELRFLFRKTIRKCFDDISGLQAMSPEMKLPRFRKIFKKVESIKQKKTFGAKLVNNRLQMKKIVPLQFHLEAFRAAQFRRETTFRGIRNIFIQIWK